MGAPQGLRSRPFEERTRLGIEWTTHEIVCCGIADVELDGGVARGQLDKVGLAEVACFMRRRGGHGFAPQLAHGFERLNVKSLCIFARNFAALENDAAAQYCRGCPAILGTAKFQSLAIIETPVGKV